MMLLSLVSMVVFGQDITLKGKLTDKADKTAIAGATVELTSQKDSSFKKMLVTDSKGEFGFNNLEPATYIVKIIPSGYEKIEQKIASVGYDTPDYKANDAAYDKLDDCCKYRKPATKSEQ